MLDSSSVFTPVGQLPPQLSQLRWRKHNDVKETRVMYLTLPFFGEELGAPAHNWLNIITV
ncbi:hypothetical protein CDQ92_12695 [Sphingopyxis bauzanensis]|jgi:hypothetical protein|uniref:Uncharacterized protein n=1 Tax=Sphingopyxis bauzanensis TaxID=651663 RepID=A0A246JRK3_9SPHN|nr:hypothetical protein FG95_01685 [Sphingopyxis sp. LC363]OWQ95644.1 hypothetical protein CDQ92_12695 [Sphingopyxis bauzanensis]GGJ38774.1 hypothetical protein GCM10011393_06260 [Sphingopyxis bauzanensis]